MELLANDGIQLETKAYSITGQEALSYSQAAEILSKVIGKKISYVDISQEDAQKSMKGIGMEDWLIVALMELYNFIKEGYASQTNDTV